MDKKFSIAIVAAIIVIIGIALASYQDHKIDYGSSNSTVNTNNGNSSQENANITSTHKHFTIGLNETLGTTPNQH